MVSDFVQIGRLQESCVFLLTEREGPVLNLRVPWQEDSLTPNFEQENNTRIVHGFIKNPHESKELIASHGSRPFREPTSRQRIRFILTRQLEQRF